MFCKKCGKEIDDEAVVCPNCGCATDSTRVVSGDNANTMLQIAFIFMIISCVAFAFCIIPLCWVIPMTISLNNKMKSGEPISVGFKVCTLIFVNTIAGVLLLCLPETRVTTKND